METLQDLSTQKSFGSFGGINYSRITGRFCGQNSAGEAFSVPFEVTFPTIPQRFVRYLVEPPHFDGGLIVRDGYFGPDFIFSRGLGYASVGYSFVGKRILDPNPGFPLIIRGKTMPQPPPGPGDTEYTDREIIALFTKHIRQRFGAKKIYSIGISDSGSAVRQILQHPLYGMNLFDLSFPGLTSPMISIPNTGRVMIFNSEYDTRPPIPTDPGSPDYRRYVVAGAPHIPDTEYTRGFFPAPGTVAPPVAGTTPIDWVPFFKAIFVAGEQWITAGTEPPPSTLLEWTPSGNIARDEKGNALGGIRHPALQLSEARFIDSIIRGNGWQLFGAYGHPRFVNQIPNYLDSFTQAADSLVDSRFLLRQDSRDMIAKASLIPPSTFTINYADGLFNFG